MSNLRRFSSQYQLPLQDVNLKSIFDELEGNKAKLNIEDYSISQTTLDEVQKFCNYNSVLPKSGLQFPPMFVKAPNRTAWFLRGL